MSLINDALKRAEKSLNKNSPSQQKEKIPSFDFEPSGKINKLFLVYLVGGTFFFTVLILLIVLLRSPSPSEQLPPIPPHNIQNIPSVIAETIVDNSKDEEQPQELLLPKTIDESSSNNTEDSTPPSVDEQPSNLSENIEEKKKSLNDEMLEGMLNLASRAFTKPSTSTNQPSKENPPPQEESKENYSLSTAPETLKMLEQQFQENKQTPSVDNSIDDFIQDLSITGVMIADNESKILINNQVYSNYSIINPSLSLQLISIQPHNIIIKDATGKTYKREF